MAEVCLQRTKANQVAEVFEELTHLAPSPLQLIERWSEFAAKASSLGLAWRFETLLETAKILVERHDGQVPSEWASLRALPGVGDYVASAVLCFAFGRRAVLLDTNTLRIARRLADEKALGLWQARLDLFDRSGKTGPDSEWNYALLDLGALLCTVRAPDCQACPVQKACARGIKTASSSRSRENSKARAAGEEASTRRPAMNAAHASRKRYQSYVERVAPGETGRLKPGDGETPAAIRRRLAAAAKALGVQLKVKRVGDRVFFWR